MNKPNPIPLVSIAVSLTPSVLPIHAKEVRCPDSCWDRRVSGLRGRPNGGFSEAHDKPRVMRALLFLMKVLQRARFNGSFIIHTVTTGGRVDLSPVRDFICSIENDFRDSWHDVLRYLEKMSRVCRWWICHAGERCLPEACCTQTHDVVSFLSAHVCYSWLIVRDRVAR